LTWNIPFLDLIVFENHSATLITVIRGVSVRGFYLLLYLKALRTLLLSHLVKNVLEGEINVLSDLVYKGTPL